MENAADANQSAAPLPRGYSISRMSGSCQAPGGQKIGRKLGEKISGNDKGHCSHPSEQGFRFRRPLSFFLCFASLKPEKFIFSAI
jgi:hypothetical protein